MDENVTMLLSNSFAVYHGENSAISCIVYWEAESLHAMVCSYQMTEDQYCEGRKYLLTEPISTRPTMIHTCGTLEKCHGSHELRGRCFLGDSSKFVIEYMLTITTSPQNERRIQSVSITRCSSTGPFNKRILCVSSPSQLNEGRIQLVDVHGNVFISKFGETTGEIQKYQPQKLLSHTCLVTKILHIRGMCEMDHFTGNRSERLCSAPSNEIADLLVIGDKDGYLRISTLQNPSFILSLCSGNETEVCAMSYHLSADKTNKANIFHLVSLDTSDTLVVHNGYSGETEHIVNLRATSREMFVSASKFHLFTLEDEIGGCLSTLLCVCASGISLFAVSPSCDFKEIASVECDTSCNDSMSLSRDLDGGNALYPGKGPVALLQWMNNGKMMVLLLQKKGKEDASGAYHMSLQTAVIAQS